MRISTSWVAAMLATLVVMSGSVYAAEPASTAKDLKLSPETLSLLQEEMREIAKGMQQMALAIPTADWKVVRDTGTKIRASYIMEKKLTPAQAKELETVLPERFKWLDADFHTRAEKISAAAAAHDAEQVVFHYARLLDSCTACHSEFASSRFSNFAARPHKVHAHQPAHSNK